MSHAGHRVLITGGGTGTGAHLAATFAQLGAEVTIVGRRAGPLEAAAKGLDRVTTAVGDVTDEAQMVALFDASKPFHIVVANAGVAASAPVTKTSLALWQQIVDVNLTGVFLTLREGLRRMNGMPWGRLITIASTTGLKGFPYVAAYSASKHGAVGLTRSIAQEVAKSGITANVLCPGYLNTEMTVRSIANIVETTGRTHEQAVGALTRSNPQGRLIEPAEVTAAVLWLCGPGSDAINGQAIAIDGGEI